jgi:hypothetical protein
MHVCVRGIVTKPVLSQESERSCMCVLGVSILSLSTIYLIDFGTAPSFRQRAVFRLTFYLLI